MLSILPRIIIRFYLRFWVLVQIKSVELSLFIPVAHSSELFLKVPNILLIRLKPNLGIFLQFVVAIQFNNIIIVSEVAYRL